MLDFPKGWAHNLSGGYRKEKEGLLQLLDQLDVKAELNSLSAAERSIKSDADERTTKLMREEELKWT